MVTSKKDTEEVVSCCGSSDWKFVTLVIFLIVSLVCNFATLYLLAGKSFMVSGETLGIKQAILEVEYAKAGGKNVYDLVNKATQIQMKQQLPQIEEFIKNGGGAAKEAVTTPSLTADTLEVADIGSLVTTLSGDTVLEGNPSAPITVIEYSDMECPFCIKQYHDTKLREKLQSQYGDKVNFAFKNNKGVNHPGTTPKALALLCAEKVGSPSDYVKYYLTIMNYTENSSVFPVSLLSTLATKVGLDASKWQSCYDQQETMSLFEAQTKEAQKYNLNGTPGTLIINNKTGKYETVEGAYPYDTFTQKIDLLLK